MERHELPEGWEWQRIGDVASVDSVPMSPQDHSGRLVNYIALENVESGTGRLVAFRPIDAGSIGSRKFRFDQRHVLLGKLRPYLNKVYTPTFDGICSTDILPILPRTNLISRGFLAYCLRSPGFVEYSRVKMDGAKMPRLRTRDLLAFEIPVPSISEQGRIAARIEGLTKRVEQAQELQKQAREDADSFLATGHRSLYERLIREHDGIPLAEAGQVMGGGTPSRSDATLWGGDIPWVSPKNMKSWHIVDSTEHITSEALQQSAVKLIPSPAVLFVVRGMILARAVPIGVSRVPLTINQDMKAIVPRDGLEAEFLAGMIKGAERLLLDQVEVAGHGTRKLETDRWGALPIPLPPIDAQQQVIQQLEQLRSRAEELARIQRHVEDELASFTPALLAKAFRGEV